jgi:sigma-B regulation protein RsbU (phosphoserine phosphatase)
MSDSPRPDVVADAEGTTAAALRSLSALGTLPGDPCQADANLNDLLRTVTRHLHRLIPCRQIRIWVARRGGERLVARVFEEERGGLTGELRRARGEGLAGWSMEHEQSLRLGPEEARPELRGEAEPFVTAMVIPLFRRGGVFGAIECLDRKDGSFTDTDFDHLDVAAEQVAFALDNALLYEETERRALEKEVLLEVSKTLSAPLDLDEVMEAIFRALRQVVRYDAAVIYLVNPSTQRLELMREVGYPEGSEEAFRLLVGEGIVGWVAKTGEPVIVPDVRRDRRYVTSRVQTRSELAAPLVLEGRTIGVFNLECDALDAYHEGHLELLAVFAAQAAVAIERARLTRELLERRRLEKELAIAREIQASFLPKRAPEVAGFELAGATQPHDEVGGDYYDFIRVSDARLGIAIADVSGKGIPAALIMAGFRMSLLAEIRNEFSMRAVMRKVNSLLHESIERDKFVTVFYGVLDFKNRVLSFSNAGHNPPLLLRAGGRVQYLLEGGVALGVLPDARYEERPIAIDPGDVLLLYTDGVSEAESPGGEQFGTRRLEECLKRLREGTANEILKGVVDEVTAWAGERGANDDLTLVVLKAKPE